jgi:hypothetical protein
MITPHLVGSASSSMGHPYTGESAQIRCMGQDRRIKENFERVFVCFFNDSGIS